MNSSSCRRATLAAACVVALLATACHDSGTGSGFPGTTAAGPPGAAAIGAPGATVPSGPAGATGPITPPAAVAISSPPPLPTGAVAHPPASIAANCSTDVTDALQSWFNSVPNNSTLQFERNACYRIDGTLFLDDRTRILIDGNGATLEPHTTGNRERGQLVLRNGSDLTVRDLVVRGANPHAGATAAAYNPDLEAQHAYSVHGATDVLLDHLQAYDTYGDFVYIGASQDPSRNVTVANSVFERSGRQGISITDAVGVTIAANVISGAGRSLIDIEPNLRSQTVRDVHIVDNVTGAATNFWIANKGANGDVGDITVSGNRMVASTGGLVLVDATRGTPRGPYDFSDNTLIANNAVTDAGATGALFFALSDNVTIRDNTVQFPSGAGMTAVELRDVHHADISGNHFDGAGRTIVADAQSGDIHGP